MSWIAKSVARESVVLAVSALADEKRKQGEGRYGDAARFGAKADHEIGVISRVTGVKEQSVRAAVEKLAKDIDATVENLTRSLS